MKAIQIKYLPPTNTKGARLKAFTEGGMFAIVPRDYALNAEDQAKKLVKTFINSRDNWDHVKVSGFGTLPNGDYVATIKGK